MLAEAFSMMRTNRKAINEVCLKTAKQRHPNELSATMHGALVIVLGMDAKVYKCRWCGGFHGSYPRS